MYLIVGIDPGKTTGIACIDLGGRLVFKDHMVFAGLEKIAKAVNGIGTPVLVAGDKPDSSNLVKKINTAFNSRLFVPEREFKLEEKRAAAKALGIKDPHERDAYVAAIAAYHSYENKFKQIEHLANDKNYTNIEEIKAKVIDRYSINEAMEGRKASRK